MPVYLASAPAQLVPEPKPIVHPVSHPTSTEPHKHLNVSKYVILDMEIQLPDCVLLVIPDACYVLVVKILSVHNVQPETTYMSPHVLIVPSVRQVIKIITIIRYLPKLWNKFL